MAEHVYSLAGARRAVELAAEMECPVVMSDEGPVPSEWMSLEKSFEVMCVTLEAIIPYACSHGVRYAMELHNARHVCTTDCWRPNSPQSRGTFSSTR